MIQIIRRWSVGGPSSAEFLGEGRNLDLGTSLNGSIHRKISTRVEMFS